MTFLAGGAAVGAAAVIFALLADQAQAMFQSIVRGWRFAPLLLTPAGFALIAYFTHRFVPQAKGSGIPQVMAARRIKGTSLGRELISLPVAGGKMALTFFGLLCGASVGREGPTVQVGAAIMSTIGTVTRIHRSGLILAGACAGVAAAFNTPLAGIVFGIEEMSQSYERSTSGLTLVTVIVAGLTALALTGDYTYFGTPHARMAGIASWGAVIAAGVVGGAAGGFFSHAVVRLSRGLPGAPGRFMATYPVVFSGLCGLGVALCGLATDNATFDTGYAQARGLLDHTVSVPPAFGFTKILATLLSSVSGIPGGIFSPSLAIGAGIGSNLQMLFSGVDPGALFLLGMVSYLTGVVQAPITAFVIVTEMADAHGMVIPLMAAAVVARTISRLICVKGIYHALAEGFLPPAREAP